ncbi:MAG: alpha/beta hydrolase [Lachnospiraceae bacterium]|nr:alpha/beta hydrolase [Lachnospiraceae bacterium]
MLQKQNWNMEHPDWEKWCTRYTDSEITPKARLLYFHGGGLIFGSREDLPQGHLERFTRAGYEILAFDYPLAPAADLEQIAEDVRESINGVCEKDCRLTDAKLPYYLWGRSAGAYLCLIVAASGRLKVKPAGILSYYGYGFLCDNWFRTPSSFYQTLPSVDASCLDYIPGKLHGEGTLDTHYAVYVYARQTGNWSRLIYKGREKFFYLNFTLRTCEELPCPLFAAHSTGDTDVPYEEFLALCERYQAKRFIESGNVHDFDRDPDNPFTAELLEASLAFLEEHQQG